MSAGRPKKTLGDLPENWAEHMLEEYGKGASDVEIKAFVLNGISNDLWDRFLREEPIFSETVYHGRQLAEAWWTRLGRQGTTKEVEVVPPLYQINMKNRFDWRDKMDHTTKGKEVQGVDPKISAILARAGFEVEDDSD